MPRLSFTLIDQHGNADVRASPPHVVVLSFFNAPCNDICPVLADEIEQADHDLGPAAADVEFVTVNTDPSTLAQSAEAPVFDGTGLVLCPNWHMVTGPLASLNSVWRSYGVSITVAEKTDLEAHTDVMDFIDPSGRPALPGHAVRRREQHGELQPAGGQHRPLGPGHRHLRRAPILDQ